MSFMLSHFNEPSASLAIRGVFSNETAMLHAIVEDDDQGLRSLFSRRSGRPNDVMVPTGDSALLVSLELNFYLNSNK